MNTEKIALLHSKLRGWVMTEWDPIGVSKYPGAFNEYDGYVREIADLLIGGASEVELARHLLSQEQNSMGLSGDPDRTAHVAMRLNRLFKEFSDSQQNGSAD